MNNYMTIDELMRELVLILNKNHGLPAITEQPCVVKIVHADGTTGTAHITKVVASQGKNDPVVNITFLAE